jgi:hypothetical protein
MGAIHLAIYTSRHICMVSEGILAELRTQGADNGDYTGTKNPCVSSFTPDLGSNGGTFSARVLAKVRRADHKKPCFNFAVFILLPMRPMAPEATSV